MTIHDTELLIKKYLNGETTTEEERSLAIEVSREDVPEDWKVIAGMLGELTVDEALFDQMMAERRPRRRIVRLWPWVAAACVAALLAIFLGPPREETSTDPQIAKVEPKKKSVEAKVTEPEQKDQDLNLTNARPQKAHRTKHKAYVSKKTTKKPQETPVGHETEPMNKANQLTMVEVCDIVPLEDPRIQFAEKASTLRERGNRVIQRVAMNSFPSNNHQLSDF